VENLVLSVGGGGHYSHVYAVSSAAKRGSVSQMRDLERWLSANPMVENFKMSARFDMWYPPKTYF
jgi:uncharacterized protein YggL (DUF469 family)